METYSFSSYLCFAAPEIYFIKNKIKLKADFATSIAT